MKKRWIYAFLLGISVKWNTNSFFEELIQFADFISSDDNRYTKHIFLHSLVVIYKAKFEVPSENRAHEQWSTNLTSASHDVLRVHTYISK